MTDTRTVQLRRYEFAPGELETFARWWSTWLAPARLAAGFTVEFAYSLPDRDEFVWAVGVAGDLAQFARVESDYLTSPERSVAFENASVRALAQHIAFASTVEPGRAH